MRKLKSKYKEKRRRSGEVRKISVESMASRQQASSISGRMSCLRLRNLFSVFLLLLLAGCGGVELPSQTDQSASSIKAPQIEIIYVMAGEKLYAFRINEVDGSFTQIDDMWVPLKESYKIQTDGAKRRFLILRSFYGDQISIGLNPDGSFRKSEINPVQERKFAISESGKFLFVQRSTGGVIDGRYPSRFSVLRFQYSPDGISVEDEELDGRDVVSESRPHVSTYFWPIAGPQLGQKDIFLLGHGGQVGSQASSSGADLFLVDPETGKLVELRGVNLGARHGMNYVFRDDIAVNFGDEQMTAYRLSEDTYKNELWKCNWEIEDYYGLAGTVCRSPFKTVSRDLSRTIALTGGMRSIKTTRSMGLDFSDVKTYPFPYYPISFGMSRGGRVFFGIHSLRRFQGNSTSLDGLFSYTLEADGTLAEAPGSPILFLDPVRASASR